MASDQQKKISCAKLIPIQFSLLQESSEHRAVRPKFSCNFPKMVKRKTHNSAVLLSKEVGGLDPSLVVLSARMALFIGRVARDVTREDLEVRMIRSE